MDIDLKPVVLFIGNYGTGKTEVSVNFALDQISKGRPIQVADLDLVNPYFRSREVRHVLREKGIDVIVPDEAFINADLPILVPSIKGAIQAPKGLTILDVGGDDVGATVLGSLSRAIETTGYDMLQVVNAKRPFSDTVKGCTTITREIEHAAKLNVTGVVGNSHLMDETDADTIIEGYRFAREIAGELDVPLYFITCEKSLLSKLDLDMFECSVLPIERQLLPPWKRKQKLGSQKFLLS